MIAILEKSFLTIKETSAYIGLSVRTIRRMIEAGKFIPHRPTPGRILLSRQEIDSVIRASANRRGRRTRS
jgi:excisionase family DNA binding protein